MSILISSLTSQLNLDIEARHLQRFNHNFRRWHNVSFPVPLYPLVAPSVLVETFEEGCLISREVNQEPPSSKDSTQHQERSASGRSASSSSSSSMSPLTTGGVFAPESVKRRSHLAETGLNLYLQMLLKDNFCHADLHPGNILVRETADGGVSSNWSIKSWGSTALRSLSSLLRIELVNPLPRLVLLDAGMIAELIPTDQRNLVGFFRALTRQEGDNLGRSILTLSERHTCKVLRVAVTLFWGGGLVVEVMSDVL